MSQGKHNPADLQEFVRLLTEHQAVLRGYIRSMIPNASDIWDVVQDTNLALWERREDFLIGTNFRAWAFAIARYRALEHRRKLQKEHKLVFDDQLVELLEQTPHDWETARLESKHRALEVCLGKLKPKDRDLISARYSGTPLAEYSKRDGRSPGSLRVILNRLRQLLRRCIDAQLAMEGGVK